MEQRISTIEAFHLTDEYPVPRSPRVPHFYQVRQILAEADENEDNVIEYKEFLPVMVDILQGIKVQRVIASWLPRGQEWHLLRPD